MNTEKLINYELTIEQIDQHIDDFVKQNTMSLNLNECKLNLRVVDMIQATIASTDLLKEDLSYYSAALNHYASIVRERMYIIIRHGNEN